jgi:hypothetical protein
MRAVDAHRRHRRRALGDAHGKELADDPEYQKRLREGKVEAPKPLPKLEGRGARRNALIAIALFGLAGLMIIAFGLFPDIRPRFPNLATPAPDDFIVLRMPILIELTMLAAAGLMMLLAGARPDVAVKSSIGVAGVVRGDLDRRTRLARQLLLRREQGDDRRRTVGTRASAPVGVRDRALRAVDPLVQSGGDGLHR